MTGSRNAPSEPRPGIVALVLLGLGALHLAPLSLSPATLVPSMSTDVQELIWRLLWGVHALATRPAGLMNANTFFPDEGTYATMDYLVGVSVLAAPFRAVTHDPLLVYNLTSLASIALSAWGTYLLVRTLAGNCGAALVGAAVFAFNPVHTVRLGQLNVLAVHALPFLLLAAHRLYAHPSPRRLLWVAAALLVALTSSGYQAVFASAALAWTTLVLTAGSPGTRWRALAGTAAAVAIAAVCFAPLAWPYVAGATEEQRARSIRDVQRHSPSAAALVLQQSAVHDRVRQLWDADGGAVDRAGATLFPGAVVVLLAIAGLVRWSVRPDRRLLALLYGGLAAGGFALSLGVNLPGYAVLFEWLPPLHFIRAPSRFSLPGLLGLSLLAAAGAAWVAGALRARRPALAVAVAPAICLLHLVEAWAPVGHPTLRYSPPPPVYGWLAAQPGEFGIVELPTDPEQNTTALVYSTYHWKPLVNGYHGSFISRFHDELLFDVLPRFPRPAALERLSQIHGLRYIVVHGDPSGEHFPLKGRYQVRRRLRQALDALPPGLRLAWRSDASAVLELVEPEDGWTGLDVRRVAAASALRGQVLTLEARAVKSALGLVGGAELVVAVDRREIGRAPVSDRFETFVFQLPDRLAPGMRTLRVHVQGSASPVVRARHAELVIGGTGVPTAAWILAVSENPDRAGPSRIEVNGDLAVPGRPGYTLAVIDPATGEVSRRAAFNVGRGVAQADRLAAYLEGLIPGAVIVGVSTGTIDANCTGRMALALHTVGVGMDPCSGRYRSHAFVGVKGASPGQAAEATSVSGRSLLEVGSRGAPPRVAVRRITIGPSSGP